MFLLVSYGMSDYPAFYHYSYEIRSYLFLMNRSFLKRPGEPNIPIQAIGLSLYEDLGRGDPEEVPGTKVTRTQWLDLSSLEMSNLIGKNILIVDEVDDTRTTLEYAVRELQKDVEEAQKQLGREGEKTRFFVFVLHVRCHCPNGPFNLPIAWWTAS